MDIFGDLPTLISISQLPRQYVLRNETDAVHGMLSQSDSFMTARDGSPRAVHWLRRVRSLYAGVPLGSQRVTRFSNASQSLVPVRAQRWAGPSSMRITAS
jgi:hypothetical protein